METCRSNKLHIRRLKFLFVFIICIILALGGFAQTKKIGGISIQSGMYRVGTSQWSDAWGYKHQYQPYYLTQIGYQRRVLFHNSQFGIDYSCNLLYKQCRYNYLKNDNLSKIRQGFGSISLPVSLRYEFPSGQFHYFIKMGTVVDLCLFYSQRIIQLENSTDIISGGVLNFLFLDEINKVRLTMGSVLSIGFVTKVNDNNSVEFDIEWQMHHLAFNKSEGFGSPDSYFTINGQPYCYFPMSFTIGCTWYFGSME